MPPRKGTKKQKLKPFRCACGEDRPSNFYGDRKTDCKRCVSKRVGARYHNRQAAAGVPSGPLKSGVNPRESLKKPEDVFDPAEVEIAARFGLTVKEYLDALGEPGT